MSPNAGLSQDVPASLQWPRLLSLCAVGLRRQPATRADPVSQTPRRIASLTVCTPPPSRGGLRQLNATPPTTRLPPSHVQFTSALPLSSALRFNRRPRRVDLLASASAGTAAATGVGRAVCYVPGGRRKAATWRNTHAPPPPSLPATRLRRVRASIHTTAAVAVSAAAAVAAAWWRGASVSLFPHHPRPGGAACWGCAPVSRAVATCVMRDDGRRVHRRAIMDDAATLPPTPPPRLVVLQDVATPPPPPHHGPIRAPPVVWTGSARAVPPGRPAPEPPARGEVHPHRAAATSSGGPAAAAAGPASQPHTPSPAAPRQPTPNLTCRGEERRRGRRVAWPRRGAQCPRCRGAAGIAAMRWLPQPLVATGGGGREPLVAGADGGG